MAVSQASAQPSLGLWVEAEGRTKPFEGPEEFRSFLEFSSQFAFTDLYCQVYREGRSWFPSQLADSEPYQLAHQAGFDPLADTINVAHGQGRKVHAWINVLRVARDSKAPGLVPLGKRAFLIDNFGRSLLDYNDRGEPPGRHGGEHLDTIGAWLDPSSPEVRRYVVALVHELLVRYPELDGIHLDMIRFPYASGGAELSFPYGPDAEGRFRTETGKEAPGRPGGAGKIVATKEEWNIWRRNQLTSLVFDIRQEMNAFGPSKELTAAVFAQQGNAELHTMQDWRNWVRSGALTAAIPMNYTKDNLSFSQNVRYAVALGDAERMRIGIGAWLLLGEPAQVSSQILAARKYGTAGVVLFSYSNLYNPAGKRLLDSIAPLFVTAKPERGRNSVRESASKDVSHFPSPIQSPSPLPAASPEPAASNTPEPRLEKTPTPPSPSASKTPQVAGPKTSATKEAKPVDTPTPEPESPEMPRIRKWRESLEHELEVQVSPTPKAEPLKKISETSKAVSSAEIPELASPKQLGIEGKASGTPTPKELAPQGEVSPANSNSSASSGTAMVRPKTTKKPVSDAPPPPRSPQVEAPREGSTSSIERPASKPTKRTQGKRGSAKISRPQTEVRSETTDELKGKNVDKPASEPSAEAPAATPTSTPAEMGVKPPLILRRPN